MSFSSVLERPPSTFAKLAEAVPRSLRRLPAGVGFLIAAAVGAFLLAGCMIALGLFTSRTLLSIAGVAHADASAPRWLANHQTSLLMDASSVGYMVADWLVLAPIVGVAGLALLIARRWQKAGFLVLAALVEVWGFTLISTFVHWQAAASARGERFPWITFPAGRVGAAIAVYGALAFLVSAEVGNRWARLLGWAFAVGLSLVVTASVMYRGGHHLVDIAGGTAMGVGALVVVVLAERVTGAIIALRATGAHTVT
jgi:membrane-associated phospholipid phosphatase